MKAKEKAIELYNKFRNENAVLAANVRAKKQALICVDEILSANPHSNPFNTVQESTHKWWREVKHEIEKL